MKFAKFSLVTNVERNRAISTVREAIAKSGGWITGHNLLSNMAATINFEIASSSLDGFADRLVDDGLKVEIDGERPGEDAGDVMASIALTFVHDDGDLKRDVPPFG